MARTPILDTLVAGYLAGDYPREILGLPSGTVNQKGVGQVAQTHQKRVAIVASGSLAKHLAVPFARGNQRGVNGIKLIQPCDRLCGYQYDVIILLPFQWDDKTSSDQYLEWVRECVWTRLVPHGLWIDYNEPELIKR